MRARVTLATKLLLLPGAALAHEVPAVVEADEAVWRPDPWLGIALVLPALLYIVGVARLWRTAGLGRGVRPGRVALFAGGWLAATVALASPLHDLADRSFFAHMIVHELLMVAAAPLLVLARPLGAFAWSLPGGNRGGILRTRPVRALFRAVRRSAEPVAATVIQAAVLSAWHLPAVFDAALKSRLVHTAQHGTLLAVSLLFWWAVLVGRRGEAGKGAAMLGLFLTMLHGTMLGALLTLAPNVWYTAASPLPLGLEPLADQQLGGLVMWVPGGLVYVAAALVLLAGWLRTAEARPGWLPAEETSRG